MTTRDADERPEAGPEAAPPGVFRRPPLTDAELATRRAAAAALTAALEAGRLDPAGLTPEQLALLELPPPPPAPPWESVTDRQRRLARLGLPPPPVPPEAAERQRADVAVFREAVAVEITGTVGRVDVVTLRLPDGTTGQGIRGPDGRVTPLPPGFPALPAPGERRDREALASPDPFAVRRLAAFASSAPAYGAARALLGATRWPVDEQGRPRFVHQVRGQHLQAVLTYQVIVPADPSDDEATLAHTELARALLKDMGRDTAWLHMLMLAYAAQTGPGQRAVVPREAVYRALGLDKRTDLPRREKDVRSQQEIARLRALGLSVLQLRFKGKDLAQELGWHRRTGALWFLTLDEFGQAFLEMNDEGQLVKRWEEWQLLVRPGEWAQPFLYRGPLRQLGYLAKEMFTRLDRRRSPWGLDFAVYLAFESRIAGATTVRVRNADLLAFAGGALTPATAGERRETYNRFLAGVEDQRAWGARPDYGEWPEAIRPDVDAAALAGADELAGAGSDGSEATPRRMPRGYWDTFAGATTTFSLPDDLAEWNALAAGKPLPKGAPARALPRGRRTKTPPPAAAPVTAADLRLVRRQRGLSARAMAQHLGLSHTMVTHMETGRRKIAPAVAERIRALKAEAGDPAGV